jgi:phosphoribosyl-dephospho-CoA transferase
VPAAQACGDEAVGYTTDEAQDLPAWLDGLSLEGVHAFGRLWDVRVEGRTVGVEPPRQAGPLCGT